MNKILSLVLLSVVTACSTSTKLVTLNTPAQRIQYPLVVESPASFEHVWGKLVDHIAIKGYPIAHLDKENGLFISQNLTSVPFVFENTNLRSDSTSILILPRLRQQQKGNEGVKASRLVFPDSISIYFNVRVRPNGHGGTFINVNIPKISIGGGHYVQKQVNQGDTIVIRTPVAVKPVDWATAVSTGNFERSIFQAISDGQISKYGN